jgi:hypothetical protein
MYLSRILIFTFLTFFLKTQLSIAQEQATARKSDYYTYADSTKSILPATKEEFIVDIRVLSDSVLVNYKNDPAFNYDNTSSEPQDWITKIKYWINQQLALIRSSKTFSTALDYFYYLLAILAMILIIRGLIKGDRRGLLFGKVANNKINIIEQEEDLNLLNFDELIVSAIENKQYRLAIRYLFLKSLKLLSDREMIELRNNKTNRQYYLEIKNSQIANVFQDATLRFEWIWYGEFPVNEEIMKSSQSDFNKLFGLIRA